MCMTKREKEEIKTRISEVMHSVHWGRKKGGVIGRRVWGGICNELARVLDHPNTKGIICHSKQIS